MRMLIMRETGTFVGDVPACCFWRTVSQLGSSRKSLNQVSARRAPLGGLDIMSDVQPRYGADGPIDTVERAELVPEGARAGPRRI